MSQDQAAVEAAGQPADGVLDLLGLLAPRWRSP
jgi:hypothetical protein